ncbi:hypothetical protein HU200_032587 [Digitaria exilis]|uniref:Uncharacterized protein n=1 Tax=Digitaria exilis TaxID=1010633 RepID=A0A835BT52_9POAL|nr:hypothetical protein HU200_032587 [Digitaria exilis]
MISSCNHLGVVIIFTSLHVNFGELGILVREDGEVEYFASDSVLVLGCGSCSITVHLVRNKTL